MRENSSKYLVIVLLLVCALFNTTQVFAISQSSISGKVRAGSFDNEVRIRIVNNTKKAVTGVTAKPSEVPGIVLNLEIEPTQIDMIAPNESAKFTVQFDISKDASTEEEYTVIFQLSTELGGLEETTPEMILTIEEDSEQDAPEGPDVFLPGEPVLKLLKVTFNEPYFSRWRYHSSHKYTEGDTGYRFQLVWQTPTSTAPGSKAVDVNWTTYNWGFSQFPKEIRLGTPFQIVIDSRTISEHHKCRGSHRVGTWINFTSSGFIPSLPYIRLHHVSNINPAIQANIRVSGVEKEVKCGWDTKSSLSTSSNYTVSFTPKGPPKVILDKKDRKYLLYSYELNGNGTEIDNERIDGNMIDITWDAHQWRDGIAGLWDEYNWPKGSDLYLTSGIELEMGGAFRGGIKLLYGIPSQDMPAIEPSPFVPAIIVPSEPDGTARSGQTGDITGDPDRIGPIDPNTLDPDKQNVADHIKQWIAVAKPPQNAVPGSNWSYDKFGRVVGSGPDMRVTGTHDSVDYGVGTPEATAWSLRKKLDSIDHCTLEEYVVAKLGRESISQCAGRYGALKKLKGEPLGKAKDIVESAGFDVSLAPGSPAGSEDETGTVESQEPGPEQYLKKGATVKLYFHSPYVPPGSVLPDFKNEKISKAIKWLKKYDFKISLKPGSLAPSALLSGAVEAQDPAAGTKLQAGEKVLLTVYSPFVDVREVPKVVGEELSKAISLLQQQGFEYSIKPGSPARSVDKSGTIESQEPGQGAHVATGTKVNITVHSNYINTAQVPDVQGLVVSKAKERLATDGFKVKLLPGPPAPTINDSGKVVSQQPAGGAEMVKGSAVAIKIYSPYVAVTVNQGRPELQCPPTVTMVSSGCLNTRGRRTAPSAGSQVPLNRQNSKYGRNSAGTNFFICEYTLAPGQSKRFVSVSWLDEQSRKEIIPSYCKEDSQFMSQFRDHYSSTKKVQAGAKGWCFDLNQATALAKIMIKQVEPYALSCSSQQASLKTKVPNVTGLIVGSAKKSLQNAGFKVKLLPGPPAKSERDTGRVAEQHPEAGTNTDRGSAVAIKVRSPYVAPGDPITRREPVNPTCQCRVETSLMNVAGSSSCSTFKEATNQQGEDDVHGRNVVVHIVNDRYVRGGNWSPQANWHYGRGFVKCQELLKDEQKSCARFCPQSSRSDVRGVDTRNTAFSGNWSGTAQLSAGGVTQYLNLNYNVDDRGAVTGTIEQDGDSVQLAGKMQGSTINLRGSKEGATFNFSGSIGRGQLASGVFGLTAPDMECVVNNMFNNTNTPCSQTTYRGSWSANQRR